METARLHPWIVALTGASGIRYGLRLLEVLVELEREVHVLVSEAALRVMREEEGRAVSGGRLSAETLLGFESSKLTFHNMRDIGAPIASGSCRVSGMVVVPCSMNTLGAIANGVEQNLIHRAADVTLKEGRPLVIVPRETPLSLIHLENLVAIKRAGARVVPAMPGFYHRPKSVADLVDQLVMKILDQMEIDNDLVTRWGSSKKNGDR